MTIDWIRIDQQRTAALAAGPALASRSMDEIVARIQKVRIRNLVAEYRTIGDFLNAGLPELIRIPNMGMKSIAKIHDVIEEMTLEVVGTSGEAATSARSDSAFEPKSTGERLIMQAVERLRDDLPYMGAIVLRGPVFLENVTQVSIDGDVAYVTTRHDGDSPHSKRHSIDMSQVVMVTFENE